MGPWAPRSPLMASAWALCVWLACDIGVQTHTGHALGPFALLGWGVAVLCCPGFIAHDVILDCLVALHPPFGHIFGHRVPLCIGLTDDAPARLSSVHTTAVVVPPPTPQGGLYEGLDNIHRTRVEGQ